MVKKGQQFPFVFLYCLYVKFIEPSQNYYDTTIKYISSVGTGTWSYSSQDSLVNFYFRPGTPDLRLLGSKVQYTAESGKSPDSIYISTKTIGPKNEPASHVMVFFKGQIKYITTDENGSFNYTASYFPIDSITFNGIGSFPYYLPVSVPLLKGKNIHSIAIKLEIEESQAGEHGVPFIEGQKKIILYYPYNKNIHYSQPLRPSKLSKEDVIMLLEGVKISRPLLSRQVDWLIAELGRE